MREELTRLAKAAELVGCFCGVAQGDPRRRGRCLPQCEELRQAMYAAIRALAAPAGPDIDAGQVERFLRILGEPSKCRSCHAAVFWIVSPKSGKRMIVNPDTVSHFATCPQAKAWRKAADRQSAD